ncbi:hypothetical protein [Nostoc sp. UHCC 0870]|uniref:hypothetical protein n=1 Tax=Nostoc sp. UHCC 0870 TaxID=2914041 RepID=UPI001EDF60E7|nr:hypothetical protein [Nostoc sp. UHCC 0870]UKP01469.1 hypothetical protein L6494_29990 [Nostoc sp. UHCC 0870]
MTISPNNGNSSEHQLQPDILPLLSMLLALEGLIATMYKEVIQFSPQIPKEKAEAESRQTKAEREEKACNRLIAIILEYAKSQGVNPYNLPYLKQKSYDQLCEYIHKNWPELISQI